MRLADLLDALLQEGRIGPMGLVVVGRTIKVQSRTCPADRHLPVLPNRVDNLALSTEDGDWFVRGEAQERFTNDADRLGQLLLRSLVGYRINKDVSIGGGYAFILTDPVGPVEFNEHRFYQELNVRLINRDGVTLDSRTRLEQRTFEEGDGTSWRFRNFVQLRVPISDKNRFVAYTEPFIELNDTQFQRGGLSVWRNFAGASFPLADGVEVVLGYLNQTVFRDGEDRMDHVANVNVFMNF